MRFKVGDKIRLPEWPPGKYEEIKYIGDGLYFYKREDGSEDVSHVAYFDGCEFELYKETEVRYRYAFVLSNFSGVTVTEKHYKNDTAFVEYMHRNKSLRYQRLDFTAKQCEKDSQ